MSRVDVRGFFVLYRCMVVVVVVFGVVACKRMSP